MDISSFVGGFDEATTSFKQIINSFTQFFNNVAVVFAYLPSDFWVIFLAAIAIILVLRILGR